MTMRAASTAQFLIAVTVVLALASCGRSVRGTDANSATTPPAFGTCAACHSAAEQGGNRIGPNLYDVIGRKAATLPGVNYSGAMRNSGVVWTPASLDRFLTGPQKMIPGTRMVQSVPDAAARREIIAYLTMQHSKN